MIKSVIKYMKVPMKVHKFSHYEVDGTKVTGITLDYKCLPNYEEKTVVNTKGKIINTRIQLFLPRTADIDELDQIEFLEVLYDIKTLNGFYGGKTTGLWVVMI